MLMDWDLYLRSVVAILVDMSTLTFHAPALILVLVCLAGQGHGASEGGTPGQGRVAASKVKLSKEAPPATLSATGLFADLATLTPSAGVESYDVNAPAWNDSATARHWFGQLSVAQIFELPEALPNYIIGSRPQSENWTIPAGAVFVQHLDLQMTVGDPASVRRIETRVLVKTSDGSYGLSYHWNDEQTDATLVQPNGETQTLTVALDSTHTRSQTWEFPAQNKCVQCHNATAGHVLSFKTAQLNRYVNGVNQIEQLAAKGCLDHSPAFVGTLPAMASLDDEKATVSQRARSYLAVNCGDCHQASGSRPYSWDARFSLTDAQTNLYRGSVNQVIVGNAAQSTLIQRMKNVGKTSFMPPIGNHVMDEAAVDLLSLWVNSELNKSPRATLTQQPGNTVATEGDCVSLTAIAVETGDSGIPSYAWYRNGSVLAAQTLPSLVIAGVTAADEGVYQVIAHTTNFTVPGKPFRLNVLQKNGAPRINSITGPTASTGFQYGIFAVDAVGVGPLTYQWRHNGKPIPGRTSQTVSLIPLYAGADSGGEYTVAVTANGMTTVSEPWIVTIVEKWGEVLPVVPNGSVTFKVNVGGPVTGLQWLKAGIPVPGATAATLTLRHITSADIASYACRVSGPGGDQTSGVHTLIMVTGRPNIPSFQMPVAQAGKVYIFTLPLDTTPGLMPATVTARGLPKGLSVSYYSSTAVISGIVSTANRAPHSFPVTITATNPMGSVTVRAVLSIIPPDARFAGVYTALIKPMPDVAPQGGLFAVRVAPSGMATGRLRLGQRSYPLVLAGGYIDANYIPGAQYVIAPTPHDALSFEAYLPAENGAKRRLFFAVDGTLLDTYNNDNPLCGLELQRPSDTYIHATSALQGWAGTRSALSGARRRYGFTMNGTVSHPGTGSFSYRSDGYSVAAARLPDRTAFTTAGWMSETLDWMIYAPLYGDKGYVIGTGKAASLGPSFITGTATWNHPAPTKPVPGDFGLFTLGLSDQ